MKTLFPLAALRDGLRSFPRGGREAGHRTWIMVTTDGELMTAIHPCGRD